MNKSGFTKISATTPESILFDAQNKKTVSVVVAKANKTEGETVDGHTILRAGTPLTGDLTARTTPFTKPADADTSSNVVGILLHDVDLGPAGSEVDANATLLLWGFVNLDRLTAKAAGLLTTNVKTGLKNAIWFLKD